MLRHGQQNTGRRMNWPDGTPKSTGNDFTAHIREPGSVFRRSRQHRAQANGLTISETASKLRDRREYQGTMKGLSKKADKRLAK